MSELGSLVELLGVEPTLKLIEAYGGTRVGVPKAMPKEHRLRDLLGDSGFALLFQYFGGDEIVVPMARSWRFDIYAEQGLKPREIALKCGCTEAAYYIHRRRKGSENQMKFNFEHER